MYIYTYIYISIYVYIISIYTYVYKWISKMLSPMWMTPIRDSPHRSPCKSARRLDQRARHRAGGGHFFCAGRGLDNHLLGIGRPILTKSY